MAQAGDALVVDASVAVKWHVDDEDATEVARLLLTRFAQGLVELVAPDSIRLEVPAAITKATRGRTPRLARDEGRAAIEEFLALGIRTFDSEELIFGAFPLVHQHDCTLYDALYLALAERLTLPFLTADSKLYRRIQRVPYVIWITDY